MDWSVIIKIAELLYKLGLIILKFIDKFKEYRCKWCSEYIQEEHKRKIKPLQLPKTGRIGKRKGPIRKLPTLRHPTNKQDKTNRAKKNKKD